MKGGRYRAITPVTNYSTTQKIRVALIDAGHTDLAVETISAPVRELEEEFALLKQRIVALEREKVNWQTESGVHRIIREKFTATTSTLAVKALVALGGLVLAVAGAILGRVIWKTT